MIFSKLHRVSEEVLETYTESELEAHRGTFSKQIIIHSAWTGRTYEGFKWRVDY